MINRSESNKISSDNRSREIKQNEENIRLIWLDKTPINSELQSKLLELNPVAQFFTDFEECIHFIKLIINEEIFIIISSEMASHFLSSIHCFRSVIQIFLYNIEEKSMDINEYSKIVDIYTNEDQLIKSIKEKLRHVERHFFSFDLFNQKQKSTRDLSKESASFLWNQMLIHILKQIPQNDLAKEEMLKKCSDYYRTNSFELHKIEEFRNNYRRDKAISWYTDECFLYKLLNRALRTEDIQLLYSFRFFITDLCFELQQENEKLKNDGIIKLYRGQIIPNEEFEKLENNIHNFISTNGFFSTSRNINIALSFTKTRDKNTNKSVLFQINADPSIESIIFADIASLGSMPHEEEVLFSLNSLFKIEQIYFDSTLDVYIIEMTATNQGIEKINEYLKWMQTELDYHSPFIYFGRLLWNELGQVDQAFNYFQILLKSISNDDPDISFLYTELGNVYHEKGLYHLAKENYQKALNIRQQQIPLDYIRIASSLNNIGIIYQQQGQLDQALEYFQQSLELFSKYYPDNDNILQKSNTLSNMASIYRDKGDLDKSLHLLTNAFNIRRHLLPNDHPLIADSLSYIGSIYHDKSDFDQAYHYYKQALDIQQIICPDDHLKKANTIRNIGLVYRDQNNPKEALDYFNRALEMRTKILSKQNHSDIAICFGDIGNIYETMGEIDLALDYYSRQLDMEEKCLSFDHPLLILHFDLLLNTLIKNNQSNKAIELCRMKLKFVKNVLVNEYDNHPYVAHILISLANLLENTDRDEAEKFYEQALSILEHKQDKKSIQKCVHQMIDFYYKLNLLDQVLKYQLKFLELQRSTLSPDNKQLGNSLRDIARLYQLNNQKDSALFYYQQSLDILQTIFGSEDEQIKDIQREILSINENRLSLNNEEKYSLKSVMPDNDTRNKPTITYSYAAKPTMRVAESAACILF